MLKTGIVFFSLFIFCKAWCQDYTIIPVNLAAQGNPQFLFFANATLINNSSSTINLFMERIEKNIPANWSSCFCHPKCVAPFVDTISFSIPPYSQDSITPSFLADSIPGIGIIRVRVYQIGYESKADTITFTGSTLLWLSVNDYTNTPQISAYPNPCSGDLSLSISEYDNEGILYLCNFTGELLEQRQILTRQKITLSLDKYNSGNYFLKYVGKKGTSASKKIVLVK